MDFVCPVQASVPEGLTYVLAIHYVLTRYVKLVATSDNSAETAVRVLIDEWITQFDIPEVIGSDQAPHFTASVFEATCKRLHATMHSMMFAHNTSVNRDFTMRTCFQAASKAP